MVVARVLVLVWFGAAASGCMTSLGTLSTVNLGAPPSVKMIRPAFRSEACRLSVLGSEPDGAPSLVDEAIGELRQQDSEIDTLRDVRLEVWGWNLLLVRRACVAVTADLGRTIPTVSIPMDHSHHHE